TFEQRGLGETLGVAVGAFQRELPFVHVLADDVDIAVSHAILRLHLVSPWKVTAGPRAKCRPQERAPRRARLSAHASIRSTVSRFSRAFACPVRMRSHAAFS